MSFSYEELAEIRHYIHQHPELSGQEYQTTAFLKERLEELGIRILESGLKTGLIAEIGSGQPVVALRADIDALPILNKRICPTKARIQESCMPVAMIFIKPVFWEQQLFSRKKKTSLKELYA